MDAQQRQKPRVFCKYEVSPLGLLGLKDEDKNRRLICGDEAIVIGQHGRHIRLTWTDGLIGRRLWRDYLVGSEQQRTKTYSTRFNTSIQRKEKTLVVPVRYAVD